MLHDINSIHTIWVAPTHGVNINALHGQKELQNSLVLSNWNPSDPTLVQVPHFAHLSSKNMKHHGVYVNISIISSLSESGNKKKTPHIPPHRPTCCTICMTMVCCIFPLKDASIFTSVLHSWCSQCREILLWEYKIYKVHTAICILYINISSTLVCTCLSSNSHQTCHISHCKNIDIWTIWTALHHPHLLHQVFVLHVFLSGQVLHRRVLENQLCYSKVL